MTTISQPEAEQHMLSTPNVNRIHECSKLYSSKPHLAGDLEHAQRIKDLWESYGIQTRLDRYDVLQNFPLESSLKLHDRDGAVAFQASLTEDEVPEDPTSSPQNGLPAFHGFSANGNVCAELVYANWGTLVDFKLLESKGISCRGRIVICKYGKVFRGLKVRAAEMFGAVGVIMYNDPQEDGEITVENGYKAYPDGPARHPKCIQRGSVDFFSVAVGDPTTPGYPSLPGDKTERREPKGSIPGIPSLPISYADAEPFIRALNGCGLAPDELDEDWQGKLKGVEYRTGPSQVKVSLNNQGDYKYSPIYNVIGTIDGKTEESVILASHHDSWSCSAIDPVSGMAAINEIAKGLSGLLERGWRPYRKVILASWDNEEYGLVGSTEFGEHYAEDLKANCVAYINVDESTNGGQVLGALGSPLMSQLLADIMAKIPSPLQDIGTVLDDWVQFYQKEFFLEPVGTGSDYTVFFHHLGIPSLDLCFNKNSKVVYPYHSNYDSLYWVTKFGDPEFRKHRAMAQLAGVLAVRLAGIPLLRFKAHLYATTIRAAMAELKARGIPSLDLSPLEKALSPFLAVTATLDETAGQPELDLAAIQDINKCYRELEHAFLHTDGLPGRPWYQHMIFAPSLWDGYNGVLFPGLVEAIETGGDTRAWVEKIASVIRKTTAIAGSHSRT